MENRLEHGIGLIAGEWPLDPQRATILFIHGSIGSKMLWEDQVTALSWKVNTVAIDLPGHGATKGPGKKTIQEHADVVLRFLDQANVPDPIPCGLSIGGAIVLHLLINFKERFRTGILVNTGARLRVMPAIFDAIEHNFSAFVESVPTLSIVSEQFDPEKRLRLAEEARQSEPDVIYGNFKACDAFDVMTQLNEIDVPVLVVAADGDQLTPPKYSQYLKDNIRSADLVTTQGAGHLSPLEKPAEINEAILAFLDRHEL
ncbi:MAG: alpha/beta fold hydrolase [Candidatus Hydrogenedentota bacterium]|nr:MAG: alpha/beta fold hydrolase [Candidatus Hydrogenedentota bacterium]